ncbi:hypothetical protein TWF679_004685 [Orbilia oligospora]|uniref:PNPLA domain-containing protein n=1 Tax=Orbilia oligospora TaxID=2813651 RepID=A0A8H8VDZ0_ORBOL|nr:hypothetical protein TWF679_004685 [Orbilia oligospora]
MEPQHLYKCMRSDCGREVPDSSVDESLRICSCPAISHLVPSEDIYGVLCADWCRKCKTKFPCSNPRHITCFESLLPREADEIQHQPKSARRLRNDAKIKSHLSAIFSTETDIVVQRRLHEEDNRVARWFIAESTEADPRRGVLYVTDRFQRLSAQGKLAENQFPSIVSFIGDTGKGKSTLIRAMIKTSTRTAGLSFNPDDLSINDLRLNSLETPVTAIQHPNFNLTPTSAGIHLYADPQTLSERSPILFADCEGFNTHTKAQAVSGMDLNRSHDDMPFRRKWTIERGEHKRESITDGLYPQFMYLFSDVICYVMDGSASVSKDIIRLLEWAARGEADSVNMEPYKALVVVINQPSNWQKEWESQEFSARDIKKYFQRIEVCYIPRRKDRGVAAELMLSKYRLLRHTILSCSKEAQTKKKESYNRFNFTDLSSQFDLAFHHFATSDGPFDMYKIARKGRVEPRKMSDHILVLMKCMEETNNLQSTQLFGEIVASSLINASLRDYQRGLGLRGLSIDTMFQELTNICENTFFGPLGQTVKKIGFAFNWYDSLYGTEYLKARVKEILSIDGKDLSMFGSPMQTGKQPITYVGVTTVKKGEIASTVANYNRTVPEQRPDFEREDNDEQDLAAWEAGLCTSAAPVYFSRYVRSGPSQDFYIDGGVKSNNPINWALNEAKQIWPELKDSRRTDILLSLGTGKFENYTLWEPSFVFNRSWVRDIIQAFLQNLNGEVVWEEFKQDKGAEKYDTKTHHRLNANLPIKKCKLDDVRQLKVLQEETERYFDPMTPKGGYRYLHSVAHRLLAKLFFFQATSRPRHDKGKGATLLHLPGVIRCRLDNHSTEVKTLVTKIAYFFSSNQDSLLDAVNENNKLPFNQDTVRRVRGHDAIFEVNHIITTSNIKSWQAVYIRFNDDKEYYPISGFPCRMDDLLSRVGDDRYHDTELPYPIPKPTKPAMNDQTAWHQPNAQARYAQGSRIQDTGRVLPKPGESSYRGAEAPQSQSAQREDVYREDNYLQTMWYSAPVN